MTPTVAPPPAEKPAAAADAGAISRRGLMLVLSVLILLFGSVIQPFTILLSLPLAIGGVAAALILTGSALSMPVLIGILMLMGIVTKNAILLIDFIIEMRARGHDRMAAVIEAGHKRAQPIVMTSIAFIAGTIPLILGQPLNDRYLWPLLIPAYVVLSVLLKVWLDQTADARKGIGGFVSGLTRSLSPFASGFRPSYRLGPTQSVVGIQWLVTK